NMLLNFTVEPSFVYFGFGKISYTKSGLNFPTLTQKKLIWTRVNISDICGHFHIKRNGQIICRRHRRFPDYGLQIHPMPQNRIMPFTLT
ncbi:MAG: hypothetical protein KBG09_08050, partial [Syntrophobacterales bacterium]|nr:hypothetical protein [Syntrophobacterales bacterium]